VRLTRHLEVMTVTATVEEPTTLERQLGTVGSAMTRDVVLVAADITAERALRRLDQKAVSGAPVVDRGRVVGVITRRDLLVPTQLDEPSDAQAMGRWSRLTSLKVSNLMTDEPVTAEPNCALVQAVRRMLDHGVNRLPVVDDAGRPLGVLTRDDVLRVVAGYDQQHRLRSPAPEARP
jgi:CBS domain-containing protein